MRVRNGQILIALEVQEHDLLAGHAHMDVRR
jgi:hypothetical protein